MLEHFIKIKSQVWIDNQAFSYKIFSLLADVYCFWELEIRQLYLFIGLFDILRLKGWSSTEHSIEYNTNGPVVNFVTVSRLVV